MKHVRAICLDLDDTLWDLGQVIARAEQATYDWLAGRYPAIAERYAVADLAALRRRVAVEFPDRAHDLPFLRKASFTLLARECGCAEDLAGEAFAAFQRVRNQVTPYPDVRPGLERLARRLPLVALTNGTADLEVIGLGNYFTAVFNAGNLGAAKPDPRAFAAVCVRLALRPAEVLHAGDNPEYDVAGARAAGMQAVWVNRGQQAWPAHLAQPEFVAGDLGQIAELLGQ